MSLFVYVMNDFDDRKVKAVSWSLFFYELPTVKKLSVIGQVESPTRFSVVKLYNYMCISSLVRVRKFPGKKKQANKGFENVYPLCQSTVKVPFFDK